MDWTLEEVVDYLFTAETPEDVKAVIELCNSFSMASRLEIRKMIFKALKEKNPENALSEQNKLVEKFRL